MTVGPPVRAMLAVWLMCVLQMLSPLWAQPEPPPVRPRVIAFTLHNTLQPVSAAVLQTNLDEANRQQPAAILLYLSSPGGLAANAAAMAQSIRNSAAPVIVYVREPHTKLAGESLLLLNAGAVSAMHPEAVLGGSRRATLWRWRGVAAGVPPELYGALQQQLAERGRQSAAPSALLQAGGTVSGEEALRAGFIDAVANNGDRLLNSLDGRQVMVHGRATRLLLHNFTLETMPLSQRQHLMRALMNPDLTVLLLTLGALLIYLEINTPGGVVPGAAGLLLVMLSLYAFHYMPLRWQGCLLLLASVGLMLAETQLQKGGFLGVGSVVCLVFGLRLLVLGPIPELEVDWGTSVGAGVGFGGITAVLLLLGARAKRAKTRTGADAMVGWLGVAQTALSPGGQVLVRGELWNARLASEKSFVPAGECVTVQQFDGTTLEVAPLPLPGQTG